MPIINITHEPNGGGVRLRRSVTIKVAIGEPPAPGSNFPKKLDHFIFQRKVQAVEDNKKVVVWKQDDEMMAHYGQGCQSVAIVLLDDDADVAFRTELAIWTKTACVCRGDGDKAIRKTIEYPKGRPWTPCMNDGCPEYHEKGLCKPSGDLYFILEDFPSLGTICKLHTSSYQSITEIRSALEDLRSVTGGRLMGVRANLTVRLEKNVYQDKKKGLVSTTKNILGLELSGSSLRALTDGMTDAALMFDQVKKRLGARSVVIVEDDEESVAPIINAEFYPIEQEPEPDSKPVAQIDVTTITPAPKVEPEPSNEVITDDEARAFYMAYKSNWTRAQAIEFFKPFLAPGGVDSRQILKVHYAKCMEWANSKPEPEHGDAWEG